MNYPLPNGEMITHPALVSALVKPGASILATLTPEKADAWHMASCIPGEAGELVTPLAQHALFGVPLDRENVVEELGDIEFYVEGLRAPLNIIRGTTLEYGEDIPSDDMTYVACALASRAADVFDVVKKWVIYNEPLDRNSLHKALGNLEVALFAIRTHFGISYEETAAGNIMKLGKRYSKMTYSDQQAQDRADKSGTIH